MVSFRMELYCDANSSGAENVKAEKTLPLLNFFKNFLRELIFNPFYF